MTPTLLAAVSSLLDQAVIEFDGTPAEAPLRAARRRVDEPLRVALAGRVKAGKSTLLNALVGEELAATDSRECTRIVTWYTAGLRYGATAECGNGVRVPLHLTRTATGAEIGLGAVAEDQIERIIVEWPSRSLEAATLIDTPGLGSLTTRFAARTESFFLEEEASPADAVVYLLRHVHPDDVNFLESFTDTVGQPAPVSALAVLSRADEVGAGRLDALVAARRISDRIALDDRIRKMCQCVVPVAGLLAQASVSLTEDEYRILRTIAEAGPDDREDLLLSADRFRSLDSSLPITLLERAHLLERLGVFGVRWAVSEVQAGARTATELARSMGPASGLDELRSLIVSRFGARREVLKARSGLASLRSVLQAHPGHSTELARAVEAVVGTSHEFAEMRILHALYVGSITMRNEEDRGDAIRLLGGQGTTPAERLGTSGADDFRGALTDTLLRWQRLAEHPMSRPEVVDTARVLVRTCEGLATTA